MNTLPSPPDKKSSIKTGTPDHEDVNLILKIYDLRRESVMREARHYVSFEWMPKSYDDVIAVASPKHPKNAFFRQVATYWDMCATFVNAGALHEDLFWQTNGEAVFFYAKLEPFLERLRTDLMSPLLLAQVEALVKRRADGADRVKAIKARIAKMVEMAR